MKEINVYRKTILQQCHFFILFVLVTTTLLEAQITFERTYGDENVDFGYVVEQTTDGGYIVAGLKSEPGPNMQYVVKTDSFGDTLWTQLYPGIGIDEPTSTAKQTLGGGYVFTGGIWSDINRTYDVSLVKADSIGNMLWLKTYGGGGEDWAHAIEVTPDSGFIMTGTTRSYGAGFYDVYLIRTDMAGDTMWTRTYGGGGSDAGLSVRNTPEGGFIVTGWSDSFGVGGVCLLKTDSLGNAQWARTYGGSGGWSVQCTPDGGYVVAGGTNPYGPDPGDVYMIKVDSLGDTLWTRTYGGSGNDHGFAVDVTTDGGYVITGYTSSYGGVYLIKTDSSGDEMWTRTYGGYYGSSIHQTPDGGYIIAGTKSCSGTGDDFYLIKTDTLGFIGIVEDDQGNIFEQPSYSQCFPNPCHLRTSIQYSIPENTYVEIEIYDVQGKLVRLLVSETKSAGRHAIEWDGRDGENAVVPGGVYFYRLQTDRHEITEKIVLLK
jgi:hypothetical protein